MKEPFVKCNSYDYGITHRIRYNEHTGAQRSEPVMYGRCNGTREQDACRCGGNSLKCDFYDYVRERAQKQLEDEKLHRCELPRNSIKRFALAGAAEFILQSGKTGKQLLYRLQRFEEDEDMYVIRCNLDGESWMYIGCYYSDRNVIHLAKRWSDISLEITPAYVRAIVYFLKNIDNVPDKLIVIHNGKCGRCGRRLKTEESISAGFGPECIKMED